MDEQRTGESPAADAALIAVLMEIERHVAANGWEQPPRLFALVNSAEFGSELGAAQPELAARLGVSDGSDPDALSAVEQDEFVAGPDLTAELAQLAWPPTVTGCALSLVRTFLPSHAEAEIPDDEDDPGAAARYVESHPDRQDIRVVVGVDRAGHRHGVARLASQPDELLAAEDLIPGLASLLAHTLT